MGRLYMAYEQLDTWSLSLGRVIQLHVAFFKSK